MKNLKYSKRLAVTVLILLGLTACAGPARLSRSTILEQNSGIAELQRRLANAESSGVNYLAPEGFKAARSNFEEAVASAQLKEDLEAEQWIKRTKERLDKAEINANTSRHILEEALINRDRAIRAGAPTLQKESFGWSEKELQAVTRLIEEGSLEEAKRRRPKLIRDYAQLELMALKGGTAQDARAALERARAERADKYAPKTFRLAEEQLQLSVSVLQANRSDREKANAHAQRAIAFAEKSLQVTELVKDFDRRDFTPEDTVLWYQEQISTISQPLGTPVAFTQPNRTLVRGLRETIDNVVKTNDDLRSQLQVRDAKVEELRLAQVQEREAVERRDQEVRQRFDYVNGLFTPEEANVYRQRQNVLLSVHGFFFAPGKTEIEAQNFALLNKINEAIKQFPGSRLEILGHTDSTGNADTNLTLSEGRAVNVARFLTETGGVDPERIAVKGLGEEKPLASNETVEGRALNRRVEVLIVNQ